MSKSIGSGSTDKSDTYFPEAGEEFLRKQKIINSQKR